MNNKYDLIIVGAGLSSIFLAYELIEPKTMDKDIPVFDYPDNLLYVAEIKVYSNLSFNRQ